MSRRDRSWLLGLALAFAFGLAVSWERWGSPVIDSGREMNQPLRLATGEPLYSSVRHIYGPLSPWLHAALYRAFGPSLSILYIDGAVTAILILALVYALSRRIMDEDAAGAATLSVMWLCVFKPAGNFILPYSYNALHGALLGLITLTLVVERRFLLAGVAAGLAVLAKTEMGAVAVATGLFAARATSSGSAARFLLAAAALPAVVYGVIAARVGWRPLVDDSYLLLYNMPAGLRYFNAQISGFDRPLQSIGRMLIAAVKLGLLAAIVASISHIVAGVRRAWLWLVASIVIVVALSLTTGMDWDRGPYLAVPFLLLWLLFGHRSSPIDHRIYALFALLSLSRMILHVRSGGAYGSFVLPMSVVLFTYAWVAPFASAFSDPRARRAARTIPLALMILAAIGTAIVVGHRYRVTNTTKISTDRGTMFAPPDVGQAFDEAIAYVGAHTRPGDPIAVVPEGTSLTFLTGRRNPLTEEITTPGFLDGAREARAIRQLDEAATPLILIANRKTEEFGATVFGRDYSQALMQWIRTRYAPCAMFGPVKDPALEIGDKPFFLRAYCRRP